MDTYGRLIKCMQEVGMMDSQQKIVDKSSMVFIAFFVELENEFKIQIPEQYLTTEVLNSLDVLIDLIDSLTKEENK